MNTRVSWIDPAKLGDVLARLMPAAEATPEVRETAAVPEIIPADFLSAPEPAPVVREPVPEPEPVRAPEVIAPEPAPSPPVVIYAAAPEVQPVFEPAAPAAPVAEVFNPPPEALLFDQIAAELEQRTGMSKQREHSHEHASLLD